MERAGCLSRSCPSPGTKTAFATTLPTIAKDGSIPNVTSTLGASKPDRAFFAGIADRIGPQDEPPLMVDDNPPVVEAARSFGWEAVLYNDLEDFTQHPWVAERLTR